MEGKPFLLLFIFSLFLVVSCNLETEAPSYIKISDFSFKSSGSQGTSDQNITDAWIFINNEHYGNFALPAEIPVPDDGLTSIKIGPGIKNTGQSAIREINPFFQFFDTTITLVDEESYVISPATEYYDSLDFLWIEDFEGSNNDLSADASSDTIINFTTQGDVFEGSKMGHIALSTSNSKAFINSTLSLNIPNNQKRVFLEMNYACDFDFTVGISITDGLIKANFPLITVSPTDLKWNKIYVDLSGTLANNQAADKYDIYFDVTTSENTAAIVNLDNLKIVSQK